MRLFIDANVLFSAAYNPAGRPARLFDLAADLGFELVSSDYAANEAMINLQRKRPEAVARLSLIIGKLRLFAWSAREPCPVPLPDKDRPILAAAIEARCDVLITGDVRDFGAFIDKPKLTGGVRIVTLKGFLELR
jgi:predicted nucleic acid-binding protein